MTSKSYDGTMNGKAMLKILTGVFLVSPSLGARSQEVRVYSGRHYNTDRQVFKTFSQKTGI